MSHAPAVSYPVGRGWLALATLMVAWMLTAALHLAWWLAAGPGDSAPGWGLASLGLATVGLLVYGRRVPTGQLSWDGEQWLWTSHAYPAGVPLEWPQIVIDLQGFVIVRTRNRAGASWTLWLEAGSSPTVWHGLRLALFARPDPGATDLQPGGSGS